MIPVNKGPGLTGGWQRDKAHSWGSLHLGDLVIVKKGRDNRTKRKGVGDDNRT